MLSLQSAVHYRSVQFQSCGYACSELDFYALGRFVAITRPEVSGPDYTEHLTERYEFCTGLTLRTFFTQFAQVPVNFSKNL